jgi:hypothetical protein
MSRHYNGDNASTRDVVRRNFNDNILGPDSADVRIVVAVTGARVVGRSDDFDPVPSAKGTSPAIYGCR